MGHTSCHSATSPSSKTCAPTSAVAPDSTPTAGSRAVRPSPVAYRSSTRALIPTSAPLQGGPTVAKAHRRPRHHPTPVPRLRPQALGRCPVQWRTFTTHRKSRWNARQCCTRYLPCSPSRQVTQHENIAPQNAAKIARKSGFEPCSQHRLSDRLGAKHVSSPGLKKSKPRVVCVGPVQCQRHGDAEEQRRRLGHRLGGAARLWVAAACLPAPTTPAGRALR